MNPNFGQDVTAWSVAGAIGWALASLWAVFVFLRYFLAKTHPLSQVFPFLWSQFDLGGFPEKSGSEFLEIQVESLHILLTATVISITTWNIGRRVRKWLSLELADPWIRLAFEFGFGIIFLNLFWIGTGLNALWYKPLWLSVGLLAVLLTVFDLFILIKKGPSKPPTVLFPPESGYRVLFLLSGFYWLFSILQNLAPETFYDSMVYHLAVPSYWLLHHGLVDFPTNFFSNYPFGAETYFLNGLAWQGTECAKMLHVVSFGVCAFMAGGWAREMAGEKAGWLTLGLTLTLPLFAVNIWSTQVEGFLSLASVLFVYALLKFIRSGENTGIWAVMTGLFAGLAISTKYTAFLVAGSALAILAGRNPQAFHLKNWKYWSVTLLGVFLLLGPWVLKNLACTGNPFFPYFMSHFPGRHLPPGGYESLLQEQHARVTTGWWSWLLLPWTLTMANPDSYNFCGPLTLATVGFLLLFRLKNPDLKFLVWLAPLLLAGGLAVTHILRFVLPFFVFYNVLAGAALGGGNRYLGGKFWVWTASLCAFFCFAYLGAINHYYYDCIGIWAGRQTRAEYLMGPGKITPYQVTAQWISENLPPDDRLLVVGDARGLYYDRPFLTNTVFDSQVLANIAREEKDGRGIAHRLKELGVDDLVVNGQEGIRVSADYHHYDLTPEEWKRLDDFIQGYAEPVFLQNFQGVYRILPAPRKAADETLDLTLFFSKPASQFVKDVQRRQWGSAEEDLNETLKLYPFSGFWKQQKAQFDKSVGSFIQ